MIPLVQERDVSTSGAEGSASFAISNDDAAHIMTILRDTLYSDKITAVLREYGSNAWDANRVAGRGGVPIKVSLPTYSEPTLKIRDNGFGMSVDDVFKIFTQYGASTKREDNEAVGMLGIGSKSGFAYSDSFTITSWNCGKRNTFVAVIDQSEKGRIDLLDTSDCDDSESGIEIQIPVRPHDITEFSRKASNVFAFFKPQPDINVELPAPALGTEIEGLGLIIKGDSYNACWTAVMGCVSYKINTNQLTGLSNSVQYISGLLNFDIGELQVSASRENLKYGDPTKAVLVDRINGIIDKYIEHLLVDIDKLSPWDRRLRVKEINSMHLKLPAGSYNSDSYIKLNPTQFQLKSKRYNGSLHTVTSIAVDNSSRFVFRDEKRAMSGYELAGRDTIVMPLHDAALALKELKSIILNNGIDGISVIKLSSIKWTRPTTAPRKIDVARSRAPCLTLRASSINADRKSERWDPVDRVALDTDIWVVLESYQATTMSDLYGSYTSDAALVELIGGKMPDIIGYRQTKTRKVNTSRLKGKEYSAWRGDELIKMLSSNKKIADAVLARGWTSIPNHGLENKHACSFVDDHIIGKFIKAAVAHRNAPSDSSTYYAVQRVAFSRTSSFAQGEWDKIVSVYPLLGSGDATVFAGNWSKHWVDYIKMIDDTNSTNSKQVDEEIAA